MSNRLLHPLLPSRGGSSAAGLGLLFALAGASGCEEVPDPCANYKLACLSVTVSSGPAELHRLRIDVDNGIQSWTELTPKKPPTKPLVYPLRFAVRFGQFDQRYRGQLHLVAQGYNQDFDLIAAMATTIPLAEAEKKPLSIALGPPLPDMMAPPPVDDGGGTTPPDLGLAPDLQP